MRQFTEDELSILDKTADLWNSILALPRHHPDELPEARIYIHQLQGLIACRCAFKPKSADFSAQDAGKPDNPPTKPPGGG